MDIGEDHTSLNRQTEIVSGLLFVILLFWIDMEHWQKPIQILTPGFKNYERDFSTRAFLKKIITQK